jgi:hypothetical protein
VGLLFFLFEALTMSEVRLETLEGGTVCVEGGNLGRDSSSMCISVVVAESAGISFSVGFIMTFFSAKASNYTTFFIGNVHWKVILFDHSCWSGHDIVPFSVTNFLLLFEDHQKLALFKYLQFLTLIFLTSLLGDQPLRTLNKNGNKDGIEDRLTILP